MGVQVRIVLYARTEKQAENAARAAFRRFAELDSMMSDYKPDSELNRLSDRAGGSPVQVSGELFFVLWRAQQIAERSQGAFDVTVGNLVQLWRKARKTLVFPSQVELKEAFALTGWRKMTLNESKQTVQLAVPGMRLDLGGIAKGYAGDCAIKVLRRHGIRSALVSAGGDIVVSDAPPNQQGWRVQIDNPEPNTPKEIFVANRAVSTSGDRFQFVEFDGKRYSHVVDPRTGLGLTEHWMGTVTSPDGITSDSLSTAVTVLGQERAIRLLKFYRGSTLSLRKVDPSLFSSSLDSKPPIK
jgi:FAD:protein FMN transferase